MFLKRLEENKPDCCAVRITDATLLALFGHSCHCSDYALRNFAQLLPKLYEFQKIYKFFSNKIS